MIKIIAVGKIKERYFSDAIAEYSKRLSAYTRLEIVQVADEKADEGISDKEALKIKDKEAEAILKNIRQGEYVIALDAKGKKMSSNDLANLIDDVSVRSMPDIDFIIGGSIGLAKRVLDSADLILSFSDMTFPHQLMRVILLEQIYRAYKIIRNEPYHK